MAKRDVELIIRARNEASKALESVNEALRQLATDSTTAQSSYGKLSASADAAAKAFSRQEAELSETESQYRSLIAQMNAAEAVLRRLREEAKQGGAGQDALAARIRLVEQAYRDLSSNANRSAVSIQRQNDALASSRNSLQAISSVANAAAASINQLTEAERRSLAAAKALGPELAKVNAEMVRQQAFAARMAEGGKTNVTPVTGDATAQRRALLEIRREWIQSEAEARRLAGAIRALGGPTNELSAAMGRAQASARLAKQQYIEQRAAMHQLGAVTQQVVVAKRSAAAAEENHTRAMARSANASRTALSWAQRFRGEILSLITAYVGFQASINAADKAIKAFTSTESAEIRLSGVVGGDPAAAAAEMAYARKEADRLGFSVQIIADQWSKFAISAQASNFTMDQTRDIFVKVLNAGRALKLGNEQMDRSFVALNQIMGKGVIQMEELRQQLGEHIPGAFAIMADAAGVSGAQLSKMIEKGELTSDYLLKFADELERRFGKQLPDALKATQAEIGRFQNQTFEAFRTVAEGGFVQAITDELKAANQALRDDSARAWLTELGATLGKLVHILAAVARNADLVVVALGAFGGAKVASLLIGLGARAVAAATAFRALQASVAVANFAMASAGPVIASTGAAASVAARGVGLLATAFRFLFSATGIGIAITAISTGLAYWSTLTDDASEAMAAHERIVGEVQAAYVGAGRTLDGWADKVKDISLKQAQTSLQTFESEFKTMTENMRRDLANTTRGTLFSANTLMLEYAFEIGGADLDAAVEELKTLARAAMDGSKPLSEINARLKEIATTASDSRIRETAAAMQDTGLKAEGLQKKAREAQLVLKAITGTADEARAAMNELAGTVSKGSESFAKSASKLTEYQDALKKLKEFIPELTAEIKFTDSMTEIEAAYKKMVDSVSGSSVKFAEKQLADAAMWRDRAIEALKQSRELQFQSKLPIDGKAIMERIIFVESSGDPLAKAKTSSAAGLAQFTEKTWLGLFDKVFPELRELNTTQKLALRFNEDASRKMLEALTRENQASLVRAGIDPNATNTYLAHFLGAGDAIKVILANPNDLIKGLVQAESIEANKSILKDKTVGQVRGWAAQKMGGASPITSNGATEAEVETAKLLETQKNITTELQHQLKIAAESERQQFVLNELKKAQLDLTTDAGRALADLAGRTFDAVNKERLAEQERENAMKRVNDLLAVREELRRQIEFHENSGDSGTADALRERLVATNDQFRLAIDNAIKFWQSVGGPEAEAALLKLEGLKTSIADLNQQVVSGKQINEMLSQGGSEFFQNFSSSVADAARGVTTWREGLIAVWHTFLQFASDFLIKIAQMIAQQALLNALGASAGGGGGGGGFAAGLINGLFRHSGGKIGTGGGYKAVPAAWFQNAVRYHGGGIAGLKPNEIPTILEQGEEVLTEGNPRHIDNIGKGGAPSQGGVKIVNAFDAASFLTEALNSPLGERVLMNFVRANRTAFRAATG